MEKGFEPSSEYLEGMANAKILVIGAGGLGCELLKCLALSGFLSIHVIDMDTIDLSNLNRQFLYRHKDVGKSKAEVAADFINKRVKGAKVVAHHKMIQDYGPDFYSQFMMVVCGVDSINARKWINGMLLDMVECDGEGNVDECSCVPLIDGGTEGFKGCCRVVWPGRTACVHCTLGYYPPAVNFPMCTIAHTPRQPEHCIEYVKIFTWPKEQPFGDVPIDGDSPDHIKWIMERSVERAEEFSIDPPDYRLTQGVVKRIIPAVASTNACIAALCVTEVIKVATQRAPVLNNYLNFNDLDGCYTMTVESEKLENCAACGNERKMMKFSRNSKLRDVVEYLKNSDDLQLKAPSIILQGSKRKTLYMAKGPLEEHTRPNLTKTLRELEVKSQDVLTVTDTSSPRAILFTLQLTDD